MQGRNSLGGRLADELQRCAQCHYALDIVRDAREKGLKRPLVTGPLEMAHGGQETGELAQNLTRGFWRSLR